METRGSDLSVDRLGATNVERKVVRKLSPLAIAHADQRQGHLQFDGWVVARAKEITKKRSEMQLRIIASRIEGDDRSENPYHAHIEKPSHLEPYVFGCVLRAIFEEHGETGITPPILPDAQTTATSSDKSITGKLRIFARRSRIAYWIRKMFRREDRRP